MYHDVWLNTSPTSGWCFQPQKNMSQYSTISHCTSQWTSQKKKTVNPEFSWVKSFKYFTIPGAREPAVSHPVPGYPKGSSPCYSHQWSCHAVETCWIHPRKIRTCSKKMNRSNTGGGAPVSCENASRWCVKKTPISRTWVYGRYICIQHEMYFRALFSSGHRPHASSAWTPFRLPAQLGPVSWLRFFFFQVGPWSWWISASGQTNNLGKMITIVSTVKTTIFPEA